MKVNLESDSSHAIAISETSSPLSIGPGKQLSPSLLHQIQATASSSSATCFCHHVDCLQHHPTQVQTEFSPQQPQQLAGQQSPQNASGTVAIPELITPTGFDALDGLLESRKWANSTITFSFPDSFGADYGATYPRYNSHASSFGQAGDGLQSVVQHWLTEIASVSNLNFVELGTPENSDTEDADAIMRIALSNDPGSAYAYSPWDTPEAADVWFNRDTFGPWFEEAVMGEYAWHTIGHELSHALGLKHGHEGGGVTGVALPLSQDSMEFSIMTYRSYENQVVTGAYANAYGNYAQTLMMLDIQAFQYLYGANYTTYAGDTTYSFSETTGEFFIDGEGQGQPAINTIFRTIWDGNGVDTYDFSNYGTSLAVDLRPGQFVDLDQGGNQQKALLGQSAGIYARGHIFNSLLVDNDRRSLIENAIGGTGNDDLRGNAASNRLEGGAGNDEINGAKGDDILIDGSGNDVLTGGDNTDRFVLVADEQRDRITDFTPGEDTLDLSQWGVTDLSQIQISILPGSLELVFGTETLALDDVDSTVFDLATSASISNSTANTPSSSDAGNILSIDAPTEAEPITPIAPSPDPDQNTPVIIPSIPEPEPPVIAILPSGTIQGQVRRDNDGDGSFEDADPGIAGVTLQLFQDSNRDGVADAGAIATTKANSNGFYQFTNLTYDRYIVTEINPARYDSTADVDGSNPDQILIEVNSNVARVKQDFLDVRILAPKKVKTTGTTKADLLEGSNQAEEIYGRGGNDQILGAGGDDDLFGNGGDDDVRGGPGEDKLRGEEGHDKLLGQGGDDLLKATNARLKGANEQDVVKGGPGQDSFVLGNRQTPYYVDAGNRDYVSLLDFKPGEDTVILHGSANQYRTTNDGSHTLLWLRNPDKSLELVASFQNTLNIRLGNDSFRYV